MQNHVYLIMFYFTYHFDRSKPGRQIVTFLLICNISMFVIYTLELQKVFANPVSIQLKQYYTRHITIFRKHIKLSNIFSWKKNKFLITKITGPTWFLWIYLLVSDSTCYTSTLHFSSFSQCSHSSRSVENHI